MANNTVHIGCGAGFAGDRTDAAGPVVETLVASGAPAYLIFETLAERTLAQAQLRSLSGNQPGYLPTMLDFVGPILKKCLQNGISIIGNFGSADPVGAAKTLRKLVDESGFADAPIGVVLGDNLLETVPPKDVLDWPLEGSSPDVNSREVVAANAYLGAEPIARALGMGARIVVTGRVADPALALGPLVHHFSWGWEDWDRLAAGTLAGHLLECGAQASGGYFCDPGFKDVNDLWNVGYPIAEIEADGSLVITKAGDTGGLVSVRTVKEQLLYEIHDPAAYLTPDVVMDLSGVRLEQQGVDRVLVQGARGHIRPDKLKVTVCLAGGWMGEAGISYAGPNAVQRARLAVDVLRKRVNRIAPGLTVHFDIIGLVSLFNGVSSNRLEFTPDAPVDDVRVRMAVKDNAKQLVERVISEVESLYTAGPAGGGGVRLNVRKTLDSASCLLGREIITPRVELY